MALLKHEPRSAEPIGRFDRMFDEWMRAFPFSRPMFGREVMPEDMIRVDEYQENGTLVVKAELPGIDPEKDVEVTVVDNVLHIEAERREEERTEEKGYVRKELRYGSFVRNLPLPQGVAESDIKASYKDGILEIRVPVAEQPAPKAPTRIAISKA